MDLTSGTIKHLQAYVKEKSTERGFDDETAGELLVLLTEELGEVMKAYRQQAGMYINDAVKTDSDIGTEIADVLIVLLELASKLDVDVESAFRKKERINEQRTYSRGNSQLPDASDG